MTLEPRVIPDWLNVSRETEAKLNSFVDLVEKWNPKINLVSAASLRSVWARHVLDSAQLWGLAPATDGIWLDVGSGGGFPGLVIAILAEDVAPNLHVTLVESDRRKSVFLSEAARQMRLDVSVLCDRIENLPPVGASVVSARALAALDILLPLVFPHMAADAVALFPKGQRHEAELVKAQLGWSMQAEVTSSKTDPEGAIVKLWGLSRG